MRLAVQADKGYTPLKLNDQNVEFLSKASSLCLNMLLIKFINNKCKHNFINNLSSMTCFGFVSHLQAEYTVVV